MNLNFSTLFTIVLILQRLLYEVFILLNIEHTLCLLNCINDTTRFDSSACVFCTNGCVKGHICVIIQLHYQHDMARSYYYLS